MKVRATRENLYTDAREIKYLKARGIDDAEIKLKLGLDHAKYKVRLKYIEQVETEVGIIQLWTYYKNSKEQLIKANWDVVKRCQENGNLNCEVGALRNISAILNEVVDTGQKLGIYHKEPERVEWTENVRIDVNLAKQKIMKAMQSKMIESEVGGDDERQNRERIRRDGG